MYVCLYVCVCIYTHTYTERESVCTQWSLLRLYLYTDFISTIQIKACLLMKHPSTAWLLPFAVRHPGILISMFGFSYFLL